MGREPQLLFDKNIDLTNVDKSTYKTNTWLNKLERNRGILIIIHCILPITVWPTAFKALLKYYSSHHHECANIY